MKKIYESINCTYADSGYYILKKVQYTVSFLVLMLIYNVIYTAMFASSNQNFIGSIMHFFALMLVFSMCFFLVAYGYIYYCQNLFIAYGMILVLDTLMEYSQFSFYTQIIIITIVVVTIHIKKIQLITELLLSNILVGVRSLLIMRSIGEGDLPVGMMHQGLQANIGIIVFSIIIFYFDKVLDQEIIESKELSNLSVTDTLTHLFNRTGYNQKIEEILGANDSYHITILDIDLFKKVNDRYGHQKGDDVLIAIADLMRDYFVSTYYVCRWGGEEFAVLSRNSETSKVKSDIDGFREMVKTYDFGIGYPLTMSGGIAYGESSDDPIVVEITADKALYHAKNNGRDQIIIGG